VVAALNVENFVVRPRRRSIEKFARPEAWKTVTGDDQIELTTQVANLPTELVDNDENAKRFDLLVLRTQLAILHAAPGFGALREQICAIAGALEGQEAVPAIRAEMVLIQAIAGDEFGLGIFIRSLVGIEREAVAQAFSGVIAGTHATPDQIEFIELIVSELTANGVMEAGRLYESPFLDISPHGPEGLFSATRVERMVQVLAEIRQRAAA